ncbi:MAG: hypothetical protein Fur0024_3740 [Patescibacteria group bacterium]
MKKFNWTDFLKIFWKILVYFILLSASFVAQKLNENLKFVVESIVLFLASSELLSILKNAGKLGVEIPTWILEKLDTSKKS